MSRTYVLSLAVAGSLVATLEAFAQAAQPATPGVQYNAVILAVSVNGLSGDRGAVFLQDADGTLYAPASFLNSLNLRTSQLHAVTAEGSVHFDLARIPGLSYSWDQEREELDISIAAEDFLATRINIGAGAARRVADYTPGAFLNYDLSMTHSPGLRASQALVDIGLFRGKGLLTSSFSAGTAGYARLMSTWQTDRIEALKTLRIGDSYNHTGAWGRGVLFGGIQYGTNFAIRPDFVTAAMPSVSGKALLPSTVDVYVNNALRTRQTVNAGPFTIQNLPVITGTGEVQMVVKDLLGREQVITQSFFASPNLLREGLVEDAYEFGWLRQNYGLRSNDYSDPFASVTYRKGLNKRLTGELRLELQQGLVAAGASAALALPAWSSVLESSVAVSGAKGLAPGAMGSVNYSFLGQRWSAHARLQLNSPSFRQLGSDPANLPRSSGAVQFSAPLGGGTLSLHYLRHLNQGQSLTRILNLNYSRQLGANMYANVALVRPLLPGAATTAAITLTVIFDPKHFGSASLNAGSGPSTLTTEFQQSTPRGEGTGYRIASLNGGANLRQETSVTHNRSFGSFQADLVRLNRDISWRLGAHGGIDLIGGGLYFSRGHGEGVAIVQVGDGPGVPVYLENQIVAHTDPRGRAVVGNLLPYQRNRISIDPLTLPLDASVDEIEKTVVPRSQGGVMVDFEVRMVRSATLAIVQADGKPLPAWTPVEVVGVEGAFVSGKRGEVSVDLPKPKGNRVIVRPEGGPACELSVDLPDSDSPAPFLGPLTCAPSR